MEPKLIIEQKITAFVNKYAVYQANADGTKGAMVAYAQQKRIALREKISFFSSEDASEVVFTMRAEKVMDLHGRYLVEDKDGNLIGAFKKEFRQSLLNSTWSILDDTGNIKITIKESNMVLAVVRRFISFLPIVGGIVELITMFLKYHFVLIDATSAKEVGRYEKTTLFRDHYLLSMTNDSYSGTDWRVVAAQSVALDALQSR